MIQNNNASLSSSSSPDYRSYSPDSTALTSLSVASELNNGQRKNCANLKFQLLNRKLKDQFNLVLFNFGIMCISTDTRPMFRPRYVGRYVGRYIDRYMSMCRSTVRRYLGRYSARHSTDTLTIDCRCNIGRLSVVYRSTVV